MNRFENKKEETEVMLKFNKWLAGELHTKMQLEGKLEEMNAQDIINTCDMYEQIC